MKRKMIALALCLLMSAYACCGCNPAGNESKNQQTSSTQASDDASAGIPENVRAKLQAALDAPPVPVPEEGWTDETLMDVIYINGEKISIPFTMEDLGEEYGFLSDEENFIHQNGKTSAVITYYGKPCGLLKSVNDVNPESFSEQDFSSITFYTVPTNEEQYPDVFPISINGITIGSSYNDMVERLGFTVAENQMDPNTSNAAFVVTGYTENFYVRIVGFEAMINHITFGPRTSE